MGEATAKALAPQGAAVAVVATELQSHLRDEISEQAAARFDDVQILQSEDIADAVVYIVTRPRHMAINEILIRPTEQEG
jgi:NADP-dependent 3-hydroxy acid dehydrogenase YdfG